MLSLIKKNPLLTGAGALIAVLLVAVLFYRGQYHDARADLAEYQSAEQQAEVEARELAAERQYQFMQGQIERLEAEREALAAQRRQEQAALAEYRDLNEQASQRTADYLDQIDALKAEYDILRARIPDAAVRLFE